MRAFVRKREDGYIKRVCGILAKDHVFGRFCGEEITQSCSAVKYFFRRSEGKLVRSPTGIATIFAHTA
jgi:hypothetical protein